FRVDEIPGHLSVLRQSVKLRTVCGGCRVRPQRRPAELDVRGAARKVVLGYQIAVRIPGQEGQSDTVNDRGGVPASAEGVVVFIPPSRVVVGPPDVLVPDVLSFFGGEFPVPGGIVSFGTVIGVT